MAKTVADMVRSFERGRYVFSDFLTLAELDECLSELRSSDFAGVPYELFGGYSEAERKVLRIGSEETLGYTEDFPISIIEVSPKNQKFADELSHRDFLGAVLNLGIDRSVTGDILIDENRGFLICLDKAAPYIEENLCRVKHTSVVCRLIKTLPEIAAAEPTVRFVTAPSLRLDAALANAFGLSRGEAAKLFAAGRVFAGGRLCESPGSLLSPGVTVSVRGYGRFSLIEECGVTKKGRLKLKLAVYGL